MRGRLILLLLIALTSLVAAATALSDGPPADTVKRDDGCSCHSAAPNSGTQIQGLQGQPEPYTAGETYALTIRSTTDVINAGLNKGGFLVYADEGTLLKPDTNADWYRTGTMGSGESWIEHTLAGDRGNVNSEQPWAFKWRAPDPSPGDVALHVFVNRVNGDGGASSDDHWNRQTFVIRATPHGDPPPSSPATSTSKAPTSSGAPTASPPTATGPPAQASGTNGSPGLSPIAGFLAVVLAVAWRLGRPPT